MSAWLVVRRALWSLDRESVNPPADADVYSEEAERQGLRRIWRRRKNRRRAPGRRLRKPGRLRKRLNAAGSAPSGLSVDWRSWRSSG